MAKNEGNGPSDARSNAVWGSGKIAGGVAVIAATAALIAPGLAKAYTYPSTTRSYSAPVTLPPPIAPVIVAAPAGDPPVDATVSWGDVSWGDVI